jgi:hypothetical protein
MGKAAGVAAAPETVASASAAMGRKLVFIVVDGAEDLCLLCEYQKNQTMRLCHVQYDGTVAWFYTVEPSCPLHHIRQQYL